MSSSALEGSDLRVRVRRALADGGAPTRGAKPAVLDAFEAAFETVRSIKPRRDIAAEGEPSGQVHLILEGWAVRSSLLFQGRRHLSAVFLAGDLCDPERVACDPPGYGLTAVTSCIVACAPRTRLRELVDADAAVRTLVMQLSAQGHAATLAHAASLGRRTASERMAHLFCTLAVRAGAGRPAERLALPLTQEELAEVTGLSVVHVNRTLQTLRAARLIALEGRKLSLPDWPAICAFAHYAPGQR